MSAPRPLPRIGWTRKYEKGETQSFYNSFFEVFDVPRRSAARCEEHVAKLDNRPGFIDLFRPGVLIVVQKSAGRDLGRADRQNVEYFDALLERDRPRCILVSDFQTLELHDPDERGAVSRKMAYRSWSSTLPSLIALRRMRPSSR